MQVIQERLKSLLNQDKKSEFRGAVYMLNPVDIAGLLSGLNTDMMLKAFRLLPKDISSEVFSYMDDDQREKLISSIGDHEIGALISDMFIDDAVDFLEEMPADLVKRVLSSVGEDQRKLINRFLSYPDNSAGSIMTIEFCSFRLGSTVADVMRDIKRTGFDKETINTLYITDENGILCGRISLRRLIMHDDEELVDDIMDTNLISVGTHDDQEVATELVRKYDLMALPVVDKGGRLVGIVTIDDIMDVVQDEATEDIEKMNALTPSDESYLRTGVWKLAGNRLPWLAIMMLGSIFTALIITHYESLIGSAEIGGMAIGVAITACIPMLMDTGGNCGSQSSTLVIRALAVGELSPRDAIGVLWREFRVAGLVSIVLACTNFLIQWLVFRRPWPISVVVSISMISTVILSKAIGALLPLGAKALKLDPALTATPLITTIVDICSLILLFEAVSRLLPLML